MGQKTAQEILETATAIDHALPFARLDFAALGVVASINGPLLPTELRVRQVDGSLTSKRHHLMLIDKPRRMKALKLARKWCAEEKFDPDKDIELLNEMVTYEEFALIIRDEGAPFTQSYPDGKSLFAAFRSIGTLAEVKGEYDAWELLNDPRYGQMDEEKMWGVIYAIAKESSTIPLMRIGGLEQASCIMLSARAALNSPRGISWRRQHSISSLAGLESTESELERSISSDSSDSPNQKKNEE